MLPLMDPTLLADIDSQITLLEKQLSSLYGKRVAALEAEIKRSQAQIQAYGATPATSSAEAAPKPAKAKTKAAPQSKKPARAAVKKKAAKQPAADKKPAASKPAKTTEKPKAPEKAEAPVQPAAPAAPAPASAAPATPAPAAKAPAAGKSQPAKKRTRTPTPEVEKRILGALQEAGLFGLSQIEVSNKTGLGYQTVVKKLKELPQIVKKGSGKEGRFYLKG